MSLEKGPDIYNGYTGDDPIKKLEELKKQAERDNPTKEKPALKPEDEKDLKKELERLRKEAGIERAITNKGDAEAQAVESGKRILKND